MKRIISESEYKLFPNEFRTGFIGLHHTSERLGITGGWGDPRDKLLCQKFATIDNNNDNLELLTGIL